MSISSNLLENLKAKGYKMTKLREHLVNLLLKTEQPLSVPEILNTLGKQFKTLNKTTLYRQLESLTAEGVVKQIELGEGKKDMR